MGLIVDDNDKGVHGELRRESFVIYSDFGEDWRAEIDLRLLDELIYVLGQIKAAHESLK